MGDDLPTKGMPKDKGSNKFKYVGAGKASEEGLWQQGAMELHVVQQHTQLRSIVCPGYLDPTCREIWPWSLTSLTSGLRKARGNGTFAATIERLYPCGERPYFARDVLGKGTITQCTLLMSPSSLSHKLCYKLLPAPRWILPQVKRPWLCYHSLSSFKLFQQK